jgi:acyl-CoA thioesterase I
MRVFAVCLAFSTGVSFGNDGPAEKFHRILFFGDSLTSGYGGDPSHAYPALIQEKIDALGWPFRVVNAGLSGETTAAGVRRLRWTMQNDTAVLLLALGGNDGLRGLPPETIKQNLQRMIEEAREKQPGVRILLAGMKIPPNYGEKYASRFESIFPELAEQNNLPLVPFLLEGVGGVRELNQPDLIHPTAEGQKIIARTVWKHLRPILESIRAKK